MLYLPFLLPRCAHSYSLSVTLDSDGKCFFLLDASSEAQLSLSRSASSWPVEEPEGRTEINPNAIRNTIWFKFTLASYMPVFVWIYEEYEIKKLYLLWVLVETVAKGHTAHLGKDRRYVYGRIVLLVQHISWGDWSLSDQVEWDHVKPMETFDLWLQAPAEILYRIMLDGLQMARLGRSKQCEY